MTETPDHLIELADEIGKLAKKHGIKQFIFSGKHGEATFLAGHAQTHLAIETVGRLIETYEIAIPIVAGITLEAHLNIAEK